MKELAKQLEAIRADLNPLMMISRDSIFTRLTGRELISEGCSAVYSMHDIARHLLSLPDTDEMLDDEYENIVIPEDRLPAPKIAAVDPVYGPAKPTNSRSHVSSRPERVPFMSMKR